MTVQVAGDRNAHFKHYICKVAKARSEPQKVYLQYETIVLHSALFINYKTSNKDVERKRQFVLRPKGTMQIAWVCKRLES